MSGRPARDAREGPQTLSRDAFARFMRKNSRTGVRGVLIGSGGYVAQVNHHGRPRSYGPFATVAEAEAAVIAVRNELFTHNDLDRRN